MVCHTMKFVCFWQEYKADKGSRLKAEGEKKKKEENRKTGREKRRMGRGDGKKFNFIFIKVKK